MSEKKSIIIVGDFKQKKSFITLVKKYFFILHKNIDELYIGFEEQPAATILFADKSLDFQSVYQILSNPKDMFFCILVSKDSFEQYLPLQTFGCVTCVLHDEACIDTVVLGIRKTIERAMARSCERNMNELVSKQMKFALMGEMLSSITHQLRQPINAVSAEMIRLKVGGFLGEVDDEFLNVLMENVNIQTQKMSKTITEFLSYFSPAKHKERFMLGALAEEIVLLYKELLNRLNIGFEVDIPGNIEIYGSKSSLLEVLVNFVSNSKDAYENKNEKLEKNKIILKAKDMGSFVTVSVQDFAGGVPPEYLTKVLTAYFTTKSSDKGTGLGLHICKSIIESEFAGSISAQNSEKGFLVTINIPKINSK